MDSVVLTKSLSLYHNKHYNKYNMTLKTLIRKIKNLHRRDVRTDQYIINRLVDQRDILLSYIYALDDDEFDVLGSSERKIKDNIKYIYENAIGCIEAYFHGRFDKSREIIFNTFFDKNNRERILLRYDDIRSKTPFFRMRSNETYELYTQLEMFHIPFEKRSLTTNQRYSISGYPCLYLGNSAYGCWEELNRPNVEMCNIVALENVAQLTVIDLSLSNMYSNEFVEADLYNMVLSLICSLKTNDRTSPFKPEYIIPQTLLSCMIRRNDKSNQIYCDGIKYTSSLYDSKRCLFDDIRLFDNYVIPIKRSKEKGYCDELSSLFAISPTTSIAINKILHPYLGSPKSLSKLDKYEVSEFGLIERWLLDSDKVIVSKL